MTSSEEPLVVLARQYAQIARLVYALEAGFRHSTPDDAAWVSDWLEKSEWARRRELHRLELVLSERLQRQRQALDSTRDQCTKAIQHCNDVESTLLQAITADAAYPHFEIRYRLARIRSLRDEAVQRLYALSDEAQATAEAACALEDARLLARTYRAHYAAMRQLRVRATARGFLLSCFTILAAATALHWWMGAP